MFLQFIRKNHYFIVKHAITVERKTLQIKTLHQMPAASRQQAWKINRCYNDNYTPPKIKKRR